MMKEKNSVITKGSIMIELPGEVSSDLRESLMENRSKTVEETV